MSTDPVSGADDLRLAIETATRIGGTRAVRAMRAVLTDPKNAAAILNLIGDVPGSVTCGTCQGPATATCIVPKCDGIDCRARRDGRLKWCGQQLSSVLVPRGEATDA